MVDYSDFRYLLLWFCSYFVDYWHVLQVIFFIELLSNVMLLNTIVFTCIIFELISSFYKLIAGKLIIFDSLINYYDCFKLNFFLLITLIHLFFKSWSFVLYVPSILFLFIKLHVNKVFFGWTLNYVKALDKLGFVWDIFFYVGLWYLQGNCEQSILIKCCRQ